MTSPKQLSFCTPFKETNIVVLLKTLWLLFMDGVQLSQGYRAITGDTLLFRARESQLSQFPKGGR